MTAILNNNRLEKRVSLGAARMHTHPDPEVELMLQVQRDEAGAFAEVVKRYWRRVFGKFFRHFRDRQYAEDLSQDVFLRLYRSRHRYQPRAKFTTWLYHISRNVLLNAVRSRQRKPFRPLSSVAEGNAEFSPDSQLTGARSEAPSRPVERAETACQVRAAVANLQGRQRRALELFQFKDFSCGQIAAAMSMSPKATRSLLYRARIQLRLTLTPYHEAER